ncbi:DUF4192 family protein [Demequina phytophila]|uniref:DUF4192 family protein n=1 Tax=Demequina phytophila TaxID=1638981 RepID=UPI0007812798|nr:DUF4192 family protein [Demequina phytophila]
MSTTQHTASTTLRESTICSLGYCPEDSLVITPTHRAGPIARIDLEPLLAEPHHEVLVRAAAAFADADAYDVTVSYWTERDASELTEVDHALTDALLATHIGRTTTVLIDETPSGIRQSDLAVITPAHAAFQARAQRAFESATPDLADYLRALERARTGRYLPAGMIGAAAACLTNVHLRDAVIVHLTGLTLKPAETGGPTEEQAGRALGLIIDPVTGERPGTRVDAHEALLSQIVAALPVETHAPARTLLTLISWWRGETSRAIRHLDFALESDDGYRLAHLLGYTFDHAIQPGWATRIR